MKILFVTANFPPNDGGIAVFNYNICKELSARGYRLVVIATGFQKDGNFDRQQGFKIIRLGGRVRPTSVETIYKILYLTFKENIDIVFFGHFGSTHWLGGVLVRKIFRIPYTILVHGTELNAYSCHFTQVDKWVSKIILKNASTIVVNSNTTKNLVESYGYPSSSIYIVHPGTDPIHFRTDSQGLNVIEKLGLGGKHVLLTASRLVEKKNHENVLKSLPLVLRKVPNLIYLIIGKGEEKERLIKITKDMCLEKYVNFIGYIEPREMPLYYNLCDVFVMPSKTVDYDYESFGIVYVEANAVGKPVIGGRSGGVGDAVINGVTGLLVDPENIEEISQAIIRLLTDQKYSKQLGENGRMRVEEELNWKMMGIKIEGILKKTITGCHRKVFKQIES